MERWEITRGNSPLIATAIHDGHSVSDEVGMLLALPEADRLREEDPFTGLWTEVAETRVVANFSRFQVDLNRPREKAVYVKPEDAWGLHVWKEEPGPALINSSLAEYDQFYKEMHDLLSGLVERFGKIVVLDLHTYNHRREGPDGTLANPEDNPEVNLGTGTMNRQLWAPVVERFMKDLTSFDFSGRHLDVRENVKFRGGQFSRWVHQSFPESVCALAVEFKKFFMDEWTGELVQDSFQAIREALSSTVPGIHEELNRMYVKS